MNKKDTYKQSTLHRTYVDSSSLFKRLYRKNKLKLMPTILTTFPVLYSKNAKGNILEWRVSIRKEDTDDAYTICTAHGLQGGKMVLHERKIQKGKGGRTAHEQAVAEAESRFRDKQEKDLYSTTTLVTRSGDPNHLNPIRPMLAQTFDPKKPHRMTFPCIVQPKYDGIRALCPLPLPGNKNDPSFISRKGLVIDGVPTRILEAIASLSFPSCIQNCVLDGELYSPDLPFEQLSGLLRRKHNKMSEKESESIGFYIFDVIIRHEETGEVLPLSFSERAAILDEIYESIRDNPVLHNVPRWSVENVDETTKLHDTLVKEQGFEGIMLRAPSGAYQAHQRSSFLQKFKTMKDDEFKIVGFREGEGDDENTVIWECETDQGRTFCVRPRGTHQHRSALLKEATTMVGSKLNVVYQEMTKEGVPRFPVGRAVRFD